MATSNKADLEELLNYVAIHPEDNDRRWILAKKLYMAWEYNDALKHLLILKKNGTRKLNILRYLAATYYRLGLYDEAITELKSIAERWPNEVAVLEQLARVYEVAARTADAARTWEQIVRISPSHPSAARSLQRLRSPSDDERRDDLRLRDSDSGIDLSRYRICKNCGAQNSDEFDRCWQCHAILREEEGPIDSVHVPSGPKSKAWVLTFIGGMATVGAVSTGLYITLTVQHRIAEGVPSGFGPVYDVLAAALLEPRLACAAVLAVVWPASLWCAFRLTGARPLPWTTAFGAGLLFTSITYLGMWAPVQWLLYAPLVSAAVSLIVVLALRAATTGKSVAAWILQGFFVLLAGIGSFAAFAGIQPITQFPAIASYNEFTSALVDPGALPVFAAVGNGGCHLQWGSTNSTWLDEQGHNMTIVAEPEDAGTQVMLQLATSDKPIIEFGPQANALTVPVQPNTRYILSASAPAGAGYVVRSHGVLQPIVEGKLME